MYYTVRIVSPRFEGATHDLLAGVRDSTGDLPLTIFVGDTLRVTVLFISYLVCQVAPELTLSRTAIEA
jgi:hypothetical protein